MLAAFLFASQSFAGSLTLGVGTVVVVADIGASDANAGARAGLLGEVCQVAPGGLSSAGEGWWKGQLSCADGGKYTFSSVSISVPGTAALARSISPKELARQLGSNIAFPDGTTTALAAGATAPVAPTAAPLVPTTPPESALRREITAGEPVKLLALHPEDAYYDNRADIVGRECYATDAMSQNEPGWHGGPISCWDGSTYYFYKVALAADPNHAPADLGGVAGGPNIGDLLGGIQPSEGAIIEDGRKVKVTEVSPDDAFFADRMRVLGKTCVVTGDLHEQDAGGGWFGGGLTCKRDYFYFYKVRVDVK